MMNDDHGSRFGPELRKERMRQGISLGEFAVAVHYSKSHLSKIETGFKSASVQFARQCDVALNCEGRLSRLVAPPVVKPPQQGHASVDEIWTMVLDVHGGDEFNVTTRRRLLSGGAAPMSLWRIPMATHGTVKDPVVLESFRSIFDELRVLGQNAAPATIAPMLVVQTKSVMGVAAHAVSTVRDRALLLASRFAEYTGWIAQETGDDRAAMWWTDHAVELASAGGDEEMAAYAFVRRALIAMYRHDPLDTVALAQEAQNRSRRPRIQGLAALREAQGHAIAGNYDDCRRALDRGAAFVEAARCETSDQPVIGTSTVLDPVATTTAWCLHDLGRSRSAVDMLQAEIERLPVDSHRSRARYGARLALALACERDLEGACAVLETVLDAMERVDSETVRMDLRALSRTLNRWHDDPVVKAVMPRLTAALHPRRG